MHGLEQLQRPRAVHQGQHEQLGLHVAHVARAGLYRESCATNDERREPAPGAVAWVAIGDSCGRSGGFFCVPSVRAATRAEAGTSNGWLKTPEDLPVQIVISEDQVKTLHFSSDPT